MAIRAQHVRRALWLSAFSVAWTGTAGTIAVYSALSSGSLSLLGFGVDAVIDAAASVTLIWRFLVEARQPERAERVERIAERVVGWVLIVLAIYLVAGSIRSLVAQSHPEGSFASLALLVASLLVLPALARAKYVVARNLGSRALRLDSLLTAVAALLALVSLAGLALSGALGLWWADAAAALFVALVVLREGWGSLVASRTST